MPEIRISAQNSPDTVNFSCQAARASWNGQDATLTCSGVDPRSFILPLPQSFEGPVIATALNGHIGKETRNVTVDGGHTLFLDVDAREPDL